jgi:hypothetical protein
MGKVLKRYERDTDEGPTKRQRSGYDWPTKRLRRSGFVGLSLAFLARVREAKKGPGAAEAARPGSYRSRFTGLQDLGSGSCYIASPITTANGCGIALRRSVVRRNGRPPAERKALPWLSIEPRLQFAARARSCGRGCRLAKMATRSRVRMEPARTGGSTSSIDDITPRNPAKPAVSYSFPKSGKPGGIFPSPKSSPRGGDWDCSHSG